MINPELAKQVPPAVQRRMVDNDHQQTLEHIKAGFLGKVFGQSDKLPVYIAGSLLFFMILTATIYTFIPYKTPPIPVEKLWGVLSPFITTLLGFVIGRRMKSSEA